jgi:hypothetical protein
MYATIILSPKKSLNTISNKRMKDSGGSTRKAAVSDLKLDIFTELDPALDPFGNSPPYISSNTIAADKSCSTSTSNLMNRVCALCGGDDASMKSFLSKAWDSKTLNDELCR